jgi:succinate dehydrogenase / fumarate reductase, iron-sulfur subunit
MPLSPVLPQQTLIFRILRFKPGVLDPPRFQDFEVQATETMSVLDGLEQIRLEHDATLMYRHSCHHSSCGTCACQINDRPRLTCITNALGLQTEVITLEPLPGFVCEGDLVVDMRAFNQPLDPEWSYLREIESPDADRTPAGVERVTRLETCIECGACVAACPAVHADSPFMGPAALAAIHTELDKSPHQREALLELAGGEAGERGCERAIECSRVCPTGVAPAKAILELRRLARS